MALPYLSDEVFVSIASSLDIPALGALGCTAQRFTTRTIADPTHSDHGEGGGGAAAAAEVWSVVDEGARRQYVAFEPWQRGMAPRLRGESWLRALHELRKLVRPHRFTISRATSGQRRPELVENGTVAQVPEGGWRWAMAVCGEAIMRRGVHYTEFVIQTRVETMVGLADASFPGGEAEWGAEGHPAGASWQQSAGFMCSTAGYRDGDMFFAGAKRAHEGDVIGLRLDFDAGTVAAYKNGKRMGLLAQPGMVHRGRDGLPSFNRPPLRAVGNSRELRWCVDLTAGSVRIDGPKPPPAITAADLAEDARKQQKFLGGGYSDGNFSSDDDGDD